MATTLREVCESLVGHRVRITVDRDVAVDPVYAGRLVAVSGADDCPILDLVDDVGTRRTVWDQVDRLRVDPRQHDPREDRQPRRKRART